MRYPHTKPLGAAAGLALAASAAVALPPGAAVALAAGALAAQPAGGTAYKIPAGACPNQDAKITAANIPAVERSVVCLSNKVRAHWGLPALTVSQKLNRSAQGWSRTLVNEQIFTHGKRFYTRIAATGYAFDAAGENLGTGFQTPAALVSAWMISYSHCRNLLSPYLSQVGDGVVARGTMIPGKPRPSRTEYETWTQDFANPKRDPYPSQRTGPVKACPHTVTIG